MNKMKEELQRTAGDVTKSKQRVIVEVERRLEEPEKKRSHKWMPLLFVAIAVICFILVSPKLLQQNNETTAGFATVDEKLYELATLRLQAYGWDEESAQDTIANQYTDYILMQKYAETFDITVTKEDLEHAQIDQTFAQMFEEMDAQMFEEMDAQMFEEMDAQMFEEMEQQVLAHFKTNDLSKKDYDKLVDDFLLPRAALKAKLIEPIAKKYSSFKAETHDFILTNDMHEYMEAKFEDQYYALLEQYEVHSPLFGFSVDEAVVMLVKEEAVLYINPNDFMFEEGQVPIRWAARFDEWDVAEGDLVTVSYNSGYSYDPVKGDDSYPNVTHVKEMKKVEDRSIRFEVDNTKLTQYMDTLYWTESNTKPSTIAPYLVTDNVRSYEGYLSEDRRHVTWYHDGQKTEMTLSKTLDLLLNLES